MNEPGAVRFVTVAMVLLTATSGLVRGAEVSYSHSLFDADEDIDTNGDLVFAVNFGSAVPIVVNGVTFAADDGAFFSGGTDYTDPSYYTGGSIGSLSQAGADALLDTTEYGPGGGNGVVSLTGLVIGKSYTVQMLFCYASNPGNIWFNYYLTSGGALSAWYGPVDRALPTVVTATFVADESVQDIWVAMSAANNGQLAAYQLRTESTTDLLLTVSPNLGNPDPIAGITPHSPGAEVTASVDAIYTNNGDTVVACTGWTGTGSVTSSGTSNQTTFTINADSAITWHWVTNAFLLDLTVTGCTTDVQDTWCDVGTNVSVTAFPTSGGSAVWHGDTAGCTITGNQIVCPMTRPRAIGVIFRSPSIARENWQHTMAAGTFGLAVINNIGDVLLTDGANPPAVLISGQNVLRILAADITGSSADELVYCADPNAGLYYYDFDTGVTSGPHGSGITDLSAGFWNASDLKMSVLVVTGTGAFRFEPNTYSAQLGGLVWVMRGDFSSGNGRDEFVGINANGNMYTYDTVDLWRQIGGGGHLVIVPGDMDTAKSGDEVLHLNSTGASQWYVVDAADGREAYNPLSGAGTVDSGCATGDTDGNGVRGYVCGGDGIMYRNTYPSGATWESSWAGNNSAFVDLILADLDGNGHDEIYGIKSTDDNTVWMFRNGAGFGMVGDHGRGTVFIVR